jgi:pimeloyl-ACP methyl ester carboxylesterase
VTQRPTRFVSRGTSRIAYDPGEPDSGKPVVICLHELLSDRFSFASVGAQLEADYRVITIDLRGHGASASLANREYGIDDLVADLESVFEREQLTGAVLLGHGLGAAIALATAVIRPELVQSLVLIDPDLGATGAEPGERESAERAADASYKELHERAISLLHGVDWQQRAGTDRAKVMRRNAPSLAALLTALNRCGFTEFQMAALTTPVEIVRSGSASAAITGQARFIANRAQLATTHLMPATLLPAALFDDAQSQQIAAIVRSTVSQPR